MTTIVWDGKELVSDSRVCEGDNIKADFQKLYRLKDGSIFGGSGGVEEILETLEWLENGSPKERPTIEEFSGILIKPSGEVFICFNRLRWRPVKAPVSIGSGSEFARAAMDCGKSARKSVELAARFDTRTGGALQILKLNTSKVRAVS